MTDNQKKFLFFSGLLSLVTGFFIFILDKFFMVEGDFGLEPHELLDEAKFFHYLATPLLIFSIGVLWPNHIGKGIKYKRTGMRSGFSLFFLLILLALSGQLLLGVTEEAFRNFLGWSHLALGILVCTVFTYHLSLKKN